MTRKGRRNQKPLWKGEVPQLDGGLMLSFNDLMEVRAVKEFLDAGLSLQKIRRAVEELQKVLDTRYPFSRETIVTDGVKLFRRTIVDGKPLLYELSRSRNYAMAEVILTNLNRGVVFKHDIAVRWHPDPVGARSVIVDPAIAFGQPVIEGTRIPAIVLYRAFKVEQSIERVGDWYQIDPSLVQQAVDFAARIPV
jgi:uncharacterized protein (DUF433 family)